jgi:four helix bundle protein
MAKHFRDLIVWQKAVELSTLIYAATSSFPKSELYGLTSQMRRASVSIASNIAEGSARGSKRDFKQFVAIARGSNYELQTQLVIAQKLKFGSEASLQKAEALSHEIGRMLSKLSDFLGNRILTTEN